MKNNHSLNLGGPEERTLKALIEIKNGKIIYHNKRCSEICKTTKYDKGFQYKTLNENLIDNKGILQKVGKIYSIKPEKIEDEEFIDYLVNIVLREKIKVNENETLYSLGNDFVFGIKKKKRRYPENDYLLQEIFNMQSSLYNIKIIKAIFLVREFAKTWRKFLDSKVPDIVKAWLWEVVNSGISYSLEKRQESDLTNLNEVRLVKFLDLDNIKKLKEPYEEGLKRIKELNPNLNFNTSIMQLFYNRTLEEKMNEYSVLYTRTMMQLIKNILRGRKFKKQKQLVDDILNWTLIEFPNEVNNISFFSDIGAKYDTKNGLYFEFKNDKYEEEFQKIGLEKHISKVVETIFKENKEKDINLTFIKLNNIINWYHHYRLYLRFTLVLSDKISEPNNPTVTNDYFIDLITNDVEKRKIFGDFQKLTNLKEEIVKIAKEEEWNDPSLKKTVLGWDDDMIFNNIRESGFRVSNDIIMDYLNEYN